MQCVTSLLRQKYPSTSWRSQSSNFQVQPLYAVGLLFQFCGHLGKGVSISLRIGRACHVASTLILQEIAWSNQHKPGRFHAVRACVFYNYGHANMHPHNCTKGLGGSRPFIDCMILLDECISKYYQQLNFQHWEMDFVALLQWLYQKQELRVWLACTDCGYAAFIPWTARL